MSDSARSSFSQKRQALVEQGRRVDAALNLARAAKAKGREERDQDGEFMRLLAGIQKETANVCHGLVLSRSADEWALAFTCLANYSTGYLAQARLTGDRNLEAGMIANLTALADGLAKALPDRKMSSDSWQRAISAIPTSTTPEPYPKPHPQVDSLSRILCVLRDSGPKLPIREFYAASESGLHIVRPA